MLSSAIRQTFLTVPPPRNGTPFMTFRKTCVPAIKWDRRWYALCGRLLPRQRGGLRAVTVVHVWTTPWVQGESDRV